MRYIKMCIFFFFFFFLFNINCKASTNTFIRTNDNLLVPDDVVVTNDNKDDILKTPAIRSGEKVYDFADLYTESEENKLYDRIIEFKDESKIDTVIVTTNDLLGFSISDFAYNFYDYNNFLENGIIFVIYDREEEPEIFMGNSGSDVFKIYTSSKINQILSYIYSDIKNEKYYKGSANYIKILFGFYNLNKIGNYELNESGKFVRTIPWFEICVLSFALTFIIIYLFLSNIYSTVSDTDNLGNFINYSTMIIKIDKDAFVETNNLDSN